MGRLNLRVVSYPYNDIVDPMDELSKAHGLQFSTYFPGGLYGEASFIVPRKITNWWEMRGRSRRLMVYGSRKLVYEGFSQELENEISSRGEGTKLNWLGAWGRLAMKLYWQKIWADTRIGDDTWQYQTGGAADKFTVDRNNRIAFIPKGVAFNLYDTCAIRYYMPTGETIKRITYNYDLTTSAAAPSWRLGIYDPVGATWLDTIDRTTAGSTTGSTDHTLATPRNYLELCCQSRAASPQTPVEDGSVYAKFTSITVYSETGSINMEEIFKDAITKFGQINSSTNFIAAASSPLSLVPFVIENHTLLADVLKSATEAGDADKNRWYAQFLHSESIPAPGGNAVLKLAQYPSLTDYDLAISTDENNWTPPTSITEDIGAMVNYVIVKYTDQMGKVQWRTPDDNASLKDEPSRLLWGTQMKPFEIGVSNSTIADNYGITLLNQLKTPPWRVSGPIAIQGAIRTKSGDYIPACEIRAGLRIRIENYMDDLSGSGLTFIISRTTYDEEDDVCTISVGEPPEEPIPTQLPRIEIEPPIVIVPVPGEPGEPGTIPVPPTVAETMNDDEFNWYEQYGNLTGLSSTGPWQQEPARVAWLNMSQAERNKWKKTTFRPWRANREKELVKKNKERRRGKKGED